MISPFFFIFASFLILARAQPDWSPLFCILASCFGYALFWRGCLHFKKKRIRFLTAVIWFVGISAIHLNWFFADRYVGSFIYLFLALLCGGLGVQFGGLTLLIQEPSKCRAWHVFALGGGWAVCEWSRLFILSGYSLDPVGVALSGTLPGMQLASAFGVYGLSFLVISTNLLALKLFSQVSKRNFFLWAILAIVPYVFGGVHLGYHIQKMKTLSTRSMHVLLVQTAILPEEKISINGSSPYSPLQQWRFILTLLVPYLSDPIDLIILPEGAVPYGTDSPIYSKEEIFEAFHHLIGISPTSSEMFETSLLSFSQGGRFGNRAWAHLLADLTGADVILGLEDLVKPTPGGRRQFCNAAFFIRPANKEAQRYEKRVLVPMGEYIPFEWCKKILSKYGIMDSYIPGKEAKIFQTDHAKIGVSICYEETYGYLMRQSRLRGAELLVNLTNDVWYPRSRLPQVHCFHGLFRAVESGVPLLRSCNTGVTCAIDSLGRILSELPYEDRSHLASPSVLVSTLPLYQYSTLYAMWGDAPVVFVGSLLFFVFLFFNYFSLKKVTLKAFHFYFLRKN